MCEEVEEWSGGGVDGGVISECFLLFVCPVSSGSVEEQCLLGAANIDSYCDISDYCVGCVMFSVYKQ